MAATNSRRVAQQAEAEATDTTVPFRGVDYVIPPALDLPIEIMEANGELEVLAVVLGDKQYKEFRATKPTLRDLRELSELVATAAGFDSLGE